MKNKMLKVTFMVLVLVLCSCTSQSDAERALSAQGFTDVRYTGYQWFACSKDDFYHTGFVAKNQNGKDVSGVVCSGIWFKSATVSTVAQP